MNKIQKKTEPSDRKGVKLRMMWAGLAKDDSTSPDSKEPFEPPDHKMVDLMADSVFRDHRQHKKNRRNPETSDFRKEVRRSWLMSYLPFIENLKQMNLNGVPYDIMDYDPKWGVSYKLEWDTLDGDGKQVWSFDVVDPSPVLLVQFYSGFPGVIGLTSKFIFSEWHTAFIDFSAPNEDIFAALKSETDYWYLQRGQKPPGPGAPKGTENSGAEPPIQILSQVGAGSIFNARIKMNARLKLLKSALAEVIKSRPKGRQGRLTLDEDNLALLRAYCTVRKKSAQGERWLTALNRIVTSDKMRDNIPAILAFVDPNNIGRYQDHPLSPKIKKELDYVGRPKVKDLGNE